MPTVRIVYHQEGLQWWADSPDVDGFAAGGDSLAEARELAREGVAFYFDDQELDIREQLANGGLVSQVRVDLLEYGTMLLPSETAPNPTGGASVRVSPASALASI